MFLRSCIYARTHFLFACKTGTTHPRQPSQFHLKFEPARDTKHLHTKQRHNSIIYNTMHQYNFTHNSLYFLAAMAMAVALSACGDDSGSGNGTNNDSGPNVNRNTVTTDEAVTRLEFPHLADSKTNIVIIHRTPESSFDKDRVNYAVEWDCNKKSQRWSCYQMHKGYNGNFSRVINEYPNDPDIPKEYRWDDDYIRNSGFQHGHICPSADRTFSYQANYQTFYMSNMQPQYGAFNGYSGSNRGLWLRMEGKVQQLASNLDKNDTMYVCKGGCIDNEEYIIKRINNKLIVPKYFFMALLMKTSQGYSAMAFWVDQTASWRMDETLAQHAISIDKLEELTGIDFFCNLPDKIENEVEKNFYPKYWGLQ